MNVTYIILGGHVEVDKYRYLYYVSMLTVYILIVCGNSTLVGLIVIHQNLHEPMYIFIAALLINSVLFSTVIYPKLLIDFLSERQIISFPACVFQAFMFYSLVGSEFFLLLAMSYDRYVSICKPLQYHTIMRKRTISMFLVSAWLLPAAHVTVAVLINADLKLCNFTLNNIFCNNSINQLYCVIPRTVIIYGVVVVINTAFLPVLFILFTYTQVFITAYQSCGEVRQKAAQTCLPHLLVLINYFSLFLYDMIIARVESNFPKTARVVMTLQTVTYTPLFNPIIYGLKMKEISKHLKRLFCQDKGN